MRLEVNGTAREVAAETLDALLVEIGVDLASVATALDGEFVPRGQRAATPLTDGARVEIVAPMQGG
ncbi:sulfur carrier protein ThiS [Thioclava sp. A2]|uniref:sulfur carrier protein ThiS n=1 Tax=Thioclava sp. FCG-A2 TaxID=3080562 RepID=UPI002952B6BD|nr:sulfur carrier protein ThiS [Thioclava sp. A2]MDV7269939.1 sulfur carrier protein ThiS [Thioclava sp. A2]